MWGCRACKPVHLTCAVCDAAGPPEQLAGVVIASSGAPPANSPGTAGPSNSNAFAQPSRPQCACIDHVNQRAPCCAPSPLLSIACASSSPCATAVSRSSREVRRDGRRMLPNLPATSPTRPPRPPVVLPPLSGPYSPARPALLPGPAQRPLTSQAPNQPMRPMMSPPSRRVLCRCVMNCVALPFHNVTGASACDLCPSVSPRVSYCACLVAAISGAQTESLSKDARFVGACIALRLVAQAGAGHRGQPAGCSRSTATARTRGASNCAPFNPSDSNASYRAAPSACHGWHCLILLARMIGKSEHHFC